MSKQQAKDIFKGGVTTWEEKTMHQLIDNIYDNDFVIESGSNQRGRWEKWSSGKLVQYGVAETTFNIETAWGPWFVGNSHEHLPFPMPFTTMPDYFFPVVTSGSATSFVTSQYVRTIFSHNGFSGIGGMRPTKATGAVAIINYIVIGKWK